MLDEVDALKYHFNVEHGHSRYTCITFAMLSCELPCQCEHRCPPRRTVGEGGGEGGSGSCRGRVCWDEHVRFTKASLVLFKLPRFFFSNANPSHAPPPSSCVTNSLPPSPECRCAPRRRIGGLSPRRSGRACACRPDGPSSGRRRARGRTWRKYTRTRSTSPSSPSRLSSPHITLVPRLPLPPRRAGR